MVCRAHERRWSAWHGCSSDHKAPTLQAVALARARPTMRIAAAVVRGVQSNGIIAVAKHYVLNSQEYDRGSPKKPAGLHTPVSEVADEATRCAPASCFL